MMPGDIAETHGFRGLEVEYKGWTVVASLCGFGGRDGVGCNVYDDVYDDVYVAAVISY